ncbi:M20/M25/M40 family metallo-hydrolase, partial [Candidatus Bathyarchaeota archaeon]|nr:M20/M25/M40 family metallo-hydrolase [Candidatus Bathyarchaeota archaeon]
MSDTIAHISCWIDENRENCIDFLQQLIAIPSPSYEEKQVAEFLKSKMTEFGFSTVKADALGDAMGVIKGRGGGRSFLLNGHIDHVPVGEMVDPYSGKLMDGAEFGDIGEVIYGRAACDMKAAVAAMVLAGRALVEQGIKLKGDLHIAAVALRGNKPVVVLPFTAGKPTQTGKVERSRTGPSTECPGVLAVDLAGK